MPNPVLTEADADLVLPVPSSATVAEVLALASSLSARGVRTTLATVLERHGSAPGTPGQKLVYAEDGTCAGTVGGGAIEREVLRALVERVTSDGGAQVREFKLGAELGMCCGGRVSVLLESLAVATPCLVVGGGHVATAVAPLLAKVGFAVTVVDARPAWAQDGRIEGVRCLEAEHDDPIVDVPVRGACLVMTHDHGLDQRVVEWALRKGYAFVGGVGSRAKAQRTRDRLEAKGFPLEARERVRMPLGLGIGARLPDEIAVSVAAELVAWRRGRERKQTDVNDDSVPETA